MSKQISKLKKENAELIVENREMKRTIETLRDNLVEISRLMRELEENGNHTR